MTVLTVEWADGVDRDDLTAALFGGECPTEGVEVYTLHPDARTIRISGTVHGIDSVWQFLTDLNLVLNWPDMSGEMEQEAS